MYTLEIEAHDLNHIDTKPTTLTTSRHETIPDLMLEAHAFVYAADRKKMLDGYSLTIHISKEKGDGTLIH